MTSGFFYANFQSILKISNTSITGADGFQAGAIYVNGDSELIISNNTHIS